VKTAKRLTLVSAIYDVIQFKQPDLYPAEAVESFTVNCTKLLDISDMVITCSERSRIDINQMCIAQRVATPPVHVFRLGDQPNAEPGEDVQQDIVQQVSLASPFVLYVSSIDARKNHAMLFRLWQRLIESHGDAIPTLVLVGRTGWRGEETLQFLKSDPKLRSKVLVLQHVDDATLHWLYENCLFTVYPSIYEGWGLPVAESLRHGKPCIASSGGAISEIAPDCADYVDPFDFAGWLKKLNHFIFSPMVLKQRTEDARKYKATDWNQAASQIIGAVRRAVCTSDLPLVPLQSKIHFSAADDDPRSFDPQNLLLGGWGRLENSGTWSVGVKSSIGLLLDRLRHKQVALQVEAYGFCPGGQNVSVTVLVNGVTAAQWDLDAEQRRYHAAIPNSVVASDNAAIVEFHIANPRSPSSAGISDDSRLLGLKVVGFSVVEISEPPVDQWLHIPDERSELVLRRPQQEQRAGLIAYTLEADSRSSVEILVEGKVARRPMIKAGREVVQTVHLSSILDPEQEIFSLVVDPVSGSGNARLTRVGFFSSPPVEALQDALVRNVSGAPFSGHVPFAGRAPRVSPNDALTPDLFSPGLAGGWHTYEPDGFWTNGRPASIYLRPEADLGRFSHLELSFYVFEPLRSMGVELEVRIGSQPAQPLINAKSSMTSTGIYTSRLQVSPEDLDEEGRLPLTFLSTAAMKAEGLTESPDNRVMAVKLRYLALLTEGEHRGLETLALDRLFSV
jgi:hypothetical protein